MQRNRHSLHALFFTHLSDFGKAYQLLNVMLDCFEAYEFIELFHAGFLRNGRFRRFRLRSLSLNRKL